MCDTAEHIYRAVRPKGIYLKPDGSIAAAAFVDKRGASVEIQLGRNDNDVVIHMSKTPLHGHAAKVPAAVCNKANVEIFYDDSSNKYHRLLLNKKRESDNDKVLTPLQAEELADGIVAVFQLDNKK